MSRLLHVLNRMKAEARFDLLTDSQQDAIAAINTYWGYPERVNLVGAEGVGKTFLGWALARTTKAVFISNPKELSDLEGQALAKLIVDNAPSDGRDLRNLIAELQLTEVRSALLISRDRNNLGLPIVQLGDPTALDIDIVYHNLSLLEHYALQPLSQGNLWEVIYSTLTIPYDRGAK